MIRLLDWLLHCPRKEKRVVLLMHALFFTMRHAERKLSPEARDEFLAYAEAYVRLLQAAHIGAEALS